MTAKEGFTLAELLIALAILGVIATFTIPKVLNSATNSKDTAKFKEAMSAISGAHSVARSENSLDATTRPFDLMSYINYVGRENSSSQFVSDDLTSGGNCGSLNCFRLHSGGLLSASTGSFAGTGATNAIYFGYNPDGNDATNGTIIFLFYNGRITTSGNLNGLDTNVSDSLEGLTDPDYVDFGS